MDIKEQSFINIQTLFDEKKERTVEALQNVYQDKPLLLSLVTALSDQVLTAEHLKDKRILLKPNWVKHSYQPSDEICLRTHDNFLMAVLELVLSKYPANVVIGDAPIQGCQWNSMITASFINKVQALSLQYNIPVQIKDFRRVIYDTVNNIETEINDSKDYVIFDVEKKSYLEPVTSAEKNLFRVSQYNPDKFMQTHQRGMHKYCITKEMFDADIIISLPKIKTHQKSGITGALKNIVGLNGDKDFLPHHRIGGADSGGDSYHGKSKLRLWSELSLDNANRKKGKPLYWFWRRLASVLWKVSLPQKNQHQLNAGWYGNDTTWRMVMDLNLIVNYGKADGSLADSQQRTLYSFCDGIIGGQADGPLRPEPLNLGVISFSNDSGYTDICMAILMGLNIEKIPLLLAARAFKPQAKLALSINGQKADTKNLGQYATQTILPPGWVNYAAQ